MIDPSARSKNQFVDADASSVEGGDSFSKRSEIGSEEGTVRGRPTRLRVVVPADDDEVEIVTGGTFPHPSVLVLDVVQL